MSKHLELTISSKKKTIKRPISFLGYTRQNPFNKTKLYLLPNQKDIVFRVKNHKCYSIRAHFTNTKNSQGDHTTYLSNKQGNKVSTVEHILSALYGLGIDSALLELSGSNEVPVFDHTAEIFVKEIIKSGIVCTQIDKQILRIKKTLFFEHSGSLAILKPSAKTVFSALIQFDKPIGEQYMSIVLNRRNYSKEIAWARPFIRQSCDKKTWEKCKKSLPSLPDKIEDCPIPVFSNGKWIVKVKSEDEPVRHKVLDLIGDLATLGMPILGQVTVIRPSHDFSRRLVNYLGKMING